MTWRGASVGSISSWDTAKTRNSAFHGGCPRMAGVDSQEMLELPPGREYGPRRDADAGEFQRPSMNIQAIDTECRIRSESIRRAAQRPGSRMVNAVARPAAPPVVELPVACAISASAHRSRHAAKTARCLPESANWLQWRLRSCALQCRHCKRRRRPTRDGSHCQALLRRTAMQDTPRAVEGLDRRLRFGCNCSSA